jgi:hypothetical protein
MRQLSAGLHAKISQRLGLEPILFVGIAWDGRHEEFYCERTLPPRRTAGPAGTDTGGPADVSGWVHGADPVGDDSGPAAGARARSKGIPGTLLSISGIDDVMNVSGSGSNGFVNITFDDTDGTIKAVIDTTDVHLAPVSVYQTFADVDDLFLVYWGEVNGPITWDERQRQLSFAAVTIVEDLEVGFSAEEGQFPNLPDDAIGKVWPLCFGQTRHVPVVTFQQVPQAQIMTNVVVPDRTYELALAFMQQAHAQAKQFTGLDAFYMALAAWNGDWDAVKFYNDKLVADQQQVARYG